MVHIMWNFIEPFSDVRDVLGVPVMHGSVYPIKVGISPDRVEQDPAPIGEDIRSPIHEVIGDIALCIQEHAESLVESTHKNGRNGIKDLAFVIFRWRVILVYLNHSYVWLVNQILPEWWQNQAGNEVPGCQLKEPHMITQVLIAIHELLNSHFGFLHLLFEGVKVQAN